jgi:putative hydrolase of HD superfamily
VTKQHAATILSLHNRLLTLKLLPRTGWLQRGVMDVESIAEHTFALSALALLVGDQIPDIDRGRLLSIALLHDIAEVLIGDLPASARRLFGAEAKQQAEYNAMLELLADLPRAEEYLALWQEYAARGSREARLVKQLDRLEMLTQALAYERNGSRVMGEFWYDIDEGWSDEFPLVQALVAQLIAERNGHQPGPQPEGG